MAEDPIIYWRNRDFPTRLSWAYERAHAGTVAVMDANSLWERVTVTPTADVPEPCTEVRVTFTHGINTIVRTGVAFGPVTIEDRVRRLREQTERDTHGKVDVHKIETSISTQTPWKPYAFNRRDFF